MHVICLLFVKVNSHFPFLPTRAFEGTGSTFSEITVNLECCLSAFRSDLDLLSLTLVALCSAVDWPSCRFTSFSLTPSTAVSFPWLASALFCSSFSWAFLLKIKCIQSKLTVAKYFLFLVDLCYDVYCGNFEKCDLYQGKCGKIFSLGQWLRLKMNTI